MPHARRLIHRILTALRNAENWHRTMLNNPLYRAAMQAIAAVLIGQINASSLKEWLWHFASTA